MGRPIYFSKIEYKEYIGYRLNSIMLLNIVEKTLSYQMYKLKPQMPTKIMRNAKTGFKAKVLATELYEQEVIFSYGIHLSETDMEKVLPLCDALKFESYRNKEMRMSDEGYIGYRDEAMLYFTAITDSYIPKLELPMSYYYDEEHIWPSEKLYRYLIKTYFENNEETKYFFTTYGGFSLFI